MQPAATGQTDCYLLERSVPPGGARLGEVYAHGRLDGLRGLVEATLGDSVSLMLTEGAVLHLWVVQAGEITEGIGLLPLLHSPDPDVERTLPLVLAISQEAEVDELLRPHVDGIRDWYDDCALLGAPVLLRIVELHERITAAGTDLALVEAARAELDRLGGDLQEGELPMFDDHEPVDDRLVLDWDALTESAPPLGGLVLTHGWVTVRWAPGVPRHPNSYLTAPSVVRSGCVDLHIGLNDLEGREDVYMFEEDRDGRPAR